MFEDFLEIVSEKFFGIMLILMSVFIVGLCIWNTIDKILYFDQTSILIPYIISTFISLSVAFALFSLGCPIILKKERFMEKLNNLGVLNSCWLREELAKWLSMSDEFLEVLTFDNLELGDKFISFPLPGDNNGHGGFKKEHYIFIKTADKVGTENSSSGIAINMKTGTESFCSLSMRVIKAG